MQMLFEETELPSMSLPEGSLAKIFPSLENELALQREREAAFGLSASDLLAIFDPSTQSLKTSQTSLLVHQNGQELGLAEFSETWPARGMMRNGQIYQLPTLAPGIGGAESGWLPTPTKSADSKGSPKGRYYGSGTCMSNLREVLRDGPDDPIFPHPNFVEELMGFPISHTELPPSEMQSSRKSRK